jgi:hypothetical protein
VKIEVRCNFVQSDKFILGEVYVRSGMLYCAAPPPGGVRSVVVNYSTLFVFVWVYDLVFFV